MIPLEVILSMAVIRGHTLVVDTDSLASGFEHEYRCRACNSLLWFNVHDQRWRGSICIYQCGADTPSVDVSTWEDLQANYHD